MNKLTHIDKQGKARMVDVSEKSEQIRIAEAEGFITLNSLAMDQIRENQNKKGDVLTVAEIAGIQAAKRNAELIPLCHQINLTKVEVNTELTENGVKASCMAKCIGQTGVEMEALTGVAICLLTIYDMCKAVDKGMIISDIKLIKKQKQ